MRRKIISAMKKPVLVKYFLKLPLVFFEKLQKVIRSLNNGSSANQESTLENFLSDKTLKLVYENIANTIESLVNPTYGTETTFFITS